MSLEFSPATKLLFIGDSLTDCGWRDDKDQLGTGYVRRINDILCATQASHAPKIFNRGIGGNKIPDLQKRWDRDVIAVAPDVLSIYIGINDVWHSFKPDRGGCLIDDYIAGYRDILTRTRRSLPACRIVLCEPSVLWLPEPADANDRLQPYVAAVHQLAVEFGIEHVVPLHDVFGRARQTRHDIALTTDGVHPTSIGHMLIAMNWLKITGLVDSIVQ